MEDTEEPLVTHMVTMRLRRRPGSGSRVSAFEATLFEKPNHRNTCLGAVPYFETNLSHRTEGTPLVNIKCTWGSTSIRVGVRTIRSRLSQLESALAASASMYTTRPRLGRATGCLDRLI